MTIKIDAETSRPLLGGARIATGPTQPIARPNIDPAPVIENSELEGFEKLPVSKHDDLDDVKEATTFSKAQLKKFPNPMQGSGMTGLSNLGNTCFMNCVLQALANVTELRDYFLSKRFRNDVNVRNPLGTQGRLAEKFYITLRHLWSQVSTGTYAPYELKTVMAERSPQFTGYMQHDAQEFMAFFLDLLHEDVNRIMDKPNFEMPDLSSYPDEIAAAESWKLHKSRNDSVIVDWFHGMLKSKLTCPQCQRESTTFDPFVFLPVPIPEGKMRMNILFCGNEVGPTRYELLVSGSEPVTYILSVASGKFSVPLNSLKLFNITSTNVCQEPDKTSSLSYYRYANFVVLQNEFESSDWEGHPVVVLQRKKSKDVCQNCNKTPDHNVKIMRCTKCKRVGYCSRECQTADWTKHKTDCCQRFVATPFAVQVPSSIALDLFLRKVDRWLNFSVKITCGEQGDSALDLRGLLQIKAFKLFKCCDSKEECLEKNDMLNFTDKTRIIIEWNSDVAVWSTFQKKCGSASSIDINDCLTLFTAPEVLTAEEAWRCPQCNDNRKATKEMSLWKLPDVLIIQLKRFSMQNRLWRRKVDDLVEFPIEGLDLSPFCVKDQDSDSIYDLFAVVNHHGSLNGGHYTSYVSLSGESEPGWRFCDDCSVTRVKSLGQLVTKSSYVMFYRRRNGKNAVSDLLMRNILNNQDLHNSKADMIYTEVVKNVTMNDTLTSEPLSTIKASDEIEEVVDDVACSSNQADPSPFKNCELPFTDMDMVD